jgi:hypothetical protein
MYGKGGAMDSLKYRQGPQFPILLRPAGGHPRNGVTALLGVARPQSRWPAAIFNPLGHPHRTPIEGARVSLYHRRIRITGNQARISWGIHGLPKVSLGPALPDHSMPCRAGSLWSSYYPLGLDTPFHMGLWNVANLKNELS